MHMLYQIIIVYVLAYAISFSDVNNISIAGFNVRSLNSSKPYLKNIFDRSDIVCIQEHRLYENELYKLNDVHMNFNVIGKASKDLSSEHQSSKPGHCGIAMFWRKNISHSVKNVECDSDRILAIEITRLYNDKSLFVIGVYLPHRACKISSFENEVTMLADLVARVKHRGEIVIIGDMNCHFGDECGSRCWGKSTRNANTLMKIFDRCDLKVIDLDGDVCTGPNFTFHVDGVGTSYIDHCVIAVCCRI